MKHFVGHSDYPSKEDVEGDPDLTATNFSLDDPIDYQKLKLAIAEFGPIQMTRAEERLKIALNISDCRCCDENCDKDVITLDYVSGATTLTTLIEQDVLKEAKSLNAFFTDFIHNPFCYFSSSAECQLAEAQIERHLGFAPLDVFDGKVDAADVKAELSKECEADFWKAHTLQSIFRTLYLQRLEIGHFNREDFIDELDQRFDDSADFQRFLLRIFDLGFLTSRLIFEHFIRDELEPIVQKGEAAAAAQVRRNKGSGEAANKKRHLRVSSMLDQIELLLSENPALKRLDLKAIAGMAIEDAAGIDPALWSQGRGRRDDYVEEIQVDHRCRDRFKKFFE